MSEIRCIDLPPQAYLAGSGRDDAILAELASMPQDAGAPVVICGAALAGTAARLQGRTKRLLVDGIASAVPLAERQAALSPKSANASVSPSRGSRPRSPRRSGAER